MAPVFICGVAALHAAAFRPFRALARGFNRALVAVQRLDAAGRSWMAVEGSARFWVGRLQPVMGLFLILTGISGLAYPLLSTVFVRPPLPRQAGAFPPGPLAASSFAGPEYFTSRPPAAGGASAVPVDLGSASDSAPDIALAAAYYQAARVAQRRGLALPDVTALIADHARGRVPGVRDEPRVNVLELNLALDRLTARKTALLTGQCPGKASSLSKACTTE
jgi:K+-transporting ATPase ATPase C chain